MSTCNHTLAVILEPQEKLKDQQILLFNSVVNYKSLTFLQVSTLSVVFPYGGNWVVRVK